MTLEFLIATVDFTDTSFIKKMFTKLKISEVNYTIINQTKKPTESEIHFSPTQKVVNYSERGISKSRNRAIDQATGEICLIADNDLVYLPNCVNAVTEQYENDPNLDVAVFQIVTPEGLPYKKYRNESFRVKKPLQQMQISSVEISFKLARIKEKGLRFNENMGLGANYTHGEELLFINACIKNGLMVKYFPIPIVIHPKESSGKTYSENNVIASGITFLKLFPVTFLLFDLYFAVKRFPRYKQTMSFYQYLNYLIKGNWLAITGKV